MGLSDGDLAILKRLASLCYGHGREEGWNGGAGYIGLDNECRLCKFGTHWTERLFKLDVKTVRGQYRNSVAIREMLTRFADKVGGPTLEGQVKELLGWSDQEFRRGEAIGYASKPLLERTIVLKVAELMLKEHEQTNGRQWSLERFHEESEKDSKSTKYVDTVGRVESANEFHFDLAQIRTRAGGSVRLRLEKDLPAEEGVSLSGDARAEQKSVLKSRLEEQKFSAGVDFDGVSKCLEEKNPCNAAVCDWLESASCFERIRKMTDKADGLFVPGTFTMALDGVGRITKIKFNTDAAAGVVIDGRARRIVADLEFSVSWEGDTPNIKEEQYDVLICGSNCGLNSEKAGVCHIEHPRKVDIHKDNQFRKGTYFTQNHNTCGLMSVLNALLSTDGGTEVLNKRFSGDKIHYAIDGKTFENADARNGEYDLAGLGSKKGYSDLECVLACLHEFPDKGVDKLGEAFFASTLLDRLGFDCTGSSQSMPLEEVFKGTQAALADGQPCILALEGHYVAIIDTYGDPGKDEEFGFVVFDAMKGGKIEHKPFLRILDGQPDMAVNIGTKRREKLPPDDAEIDRLNGQIACINRLVDCRILEGFEPLDEISKDPKNSARIGELFFARTREARRRFDSILKQLGIDANQDIDAFIKEVNSCTSNEELKNHMLPKIVSIEDAKVRKKFPGLPDGLTLEAWVRSGKFNVDGVTLFELRRKHRKAIYDSLTKCFVGKDPYNKKLKNDILAAVLGGNASDNEWQQRLCKLAEANQHVNEALESYYKSLVT